MSIDVVPAPHGRRDGLLAFPPGRRDDAVEDFPHTN
jgi:hypothetical protein